MIYYYFNQKTEDFVILDSTTREVTILEKLEGIRVITSSEMANPTHEPKKYKNHNWDSVSGKARKYTKKPKAERKKSACKVCGKTGHNRKTCPANAAPPPADEG